MILQCLVRNSAEKSLPTAIQGLMIDTEVGSETSGAQTA
jgi:hypothetical protein